MLITLGAVFLSVALLIGVVATFALSRSTGRRRLEALSQPRMVTAGILVEEGGLTEVPDPEWNRLLNALPTSRGSVKRLRREMAMAGYDSAMAAALLSLSELVLPVIFSLSAYIMLTGAQRWLGVIFGLVAGYLGPGILLGMRIKKRKKQIENGLADTLDLLVL